MASTLNKFDLKDFWQSTALLAWCPWLLILVPFNPKWISKQTFCAFISVSICVAFGAIFFKETFPGYYFLMCLFFTAGGFLGLKGIGIFAVFWFWIKTVDYYPYPFNTGYFWLWSALTGAGMIWATRDSYNTELKNLNPDQEPKNKVVRATVKTALVSFIFFGFIAAILIAVIFGENVGSPRYYHWTQ